MDILKKIILSLLVCSVLQSNELNQYLDTLDNKKIGIVGLAAPFIEYGHITEKKSLFIENICLRFELAIRESLVSKHIDLQPIIYKNKKIFPSDHKDNYGELREFLRMDYLKILNRVAQENNVDYIIFMKFNRPIYKKFLRDRSLRLVFCIYLYNAHADSKVCSFIHIKVSSPSGWRVYNGQISQNKIMNMVSKKLFILFMKSDGKNNKLSTSSSDTW